MKQNRIFLAMILLAAAGAACAQTASKPATAAPKVATSPAKPAARPTTATARPATTAAKPGATAVRTPAKATAAASKLPAGVPVVEGIVKDAFALRYEDISIGTGADAAPNKLYKVNYTGYFGANGRDDDGHKFDSSFDHRAPVMGADNKPVMDEDGKPKLGDPQPLVFPQGMGRLIPGFDQGFEGMKIGGKRRLFIPYQLAYGSAGRPGPDPAHPGSPPKADLIFDVELVDVTDMPTAPTRPPMPTQPARPFGSVPPSPGRVTGQPVPDPDASHTVPPPTPLPATAPAAPPQPK